MTKTPHDVIARHLSSAVNPTEQANRRADRMLAALSDAGLAIHDTRTHVAVPREPTETMHAAARDWSLQKYGRGIGRDGSEGCYRAMLAAAEEPDHAD